jgi:rubrerythrin
MSIKGTKTEKVLLTAFAGESQARGRYTLFAKIARKEGYELIARVFEETAANEFIHAEEFFELLEGEPLEITASYPAGRLGTTLENLEQAAAGEQGEWTIDYPHFALVAKEEGFTKASSLFTLIGLVEKGHEARYRAIHKQLAENTLWKKTKPTTWRCLNCGYQVVAPAAPEKCPICGKVHTWFENLEERYL